MNYRYVIRTRETGDRIDVCCTLADARRLIELFEAEDKYDGIFEENFYEIYDMVNEEIVY